MKPPPPELRRLVDRLLDSDPLTRPEMARLEELLEDDDHLAYYLQLTQQEATLPETLGEIPAAIVPFRRRPWLALAGMAAAACVMFFIGLETGRHFEPATPLGQSEPVPDDENLPAARITGLMGVRWSDADHPDLLSHSGALDKLAIDSGLVEITYASGVRVTVEGPAEFDVVDRESGRLGNGKLVASVPKGAEGFRIDYADGTVVDLGTEFAMDVRKDGPTDIGVFDGEIELHTGDRPEPMPLFTNHAVRHDLSDAKKPLQVIPFDREKYVRRLPNRDFAWEITSPEVQELEFDVSHLVWKPADYRAIFKWFNGPNVLEIEAVELRHDGQPVARDEHRGTTGYLAHVHDNVYRLDLSDVPTQSGRWTLHATVRPIDGTTPILSAGILQFEEGLASSAVEADFVGKWRYHFAGSEFIRGFRPDGSIRLYENGEWRSGAFADSRWSVENGVLKSYIPRLDATESHTLRDRDTLLFISQPYENARRVEE